MSTLSSGPTHVGENRQGVSAVQTGEKRIRQAPGGVRLGIPVEGQLRVPAARPPIHRPALPGSGLIANLTIDTLPATMRGTITAGGEGGTLFSGLGL